MSIQNRILEGTLDLRLRGTELHALAYLGTGADSTGVVGVDETGRSLADPLNLAETVGLAPSTIYGVLNRLEKFGYIQWQRGWSPERGGFDARPSQIRIILPSAQS